MVTATLGHLILSRKTQKRQKMHHLVCLQEPRKSRAAKTDERLQTVAMNKATWKSMDVSQTPRDLFVLAGPLRSLLLLDERLQGLGICTAHPVKLF